LSSGTLSLYSLLVILCGSGGVLRLQEAIEAIVAERQDLVKQRESKMKQVTHLAENVADLKLQLESLLKQDQLKTQQYGKQATTCLL